MNKLSVALLSSVLVISGCSSPEDSKPSEPPRVITLSDGPGTPLEFTKGKDLSKDVAYAVMNLQKEAFWTMHFSMASRPDEKFTVAFAAPDRYQMKAPGEEMIAVGMESWVKQGERWVKSDFDYGKAIMGMRPNLTAETIATLEGARVVGKEAVSGRTASMYSYVDGENTNLFWIDDENGRLLKTTVKSEAAGGMPERTLTFDYSTPVKIDKPATN